VKGPVPQLHPDGGTDADEELAVAGVDLSNQFRPEFTDKIKLALILVHMTILALIPLSQSQTNIYLINT
jgi:hypothetical protein